MENTPLKYPHREIVHQHNFDIRKMKRQVQFYRKRYMSQSTKMVSEDNQTICISDSSFIPTIQKYQEVYKRMQDAKLSLYDIDKLVQKVKAFNQFDSLEGVIGLGYLFTNHIPLNVSQKQVTDSGVIPSLIKLLKWQHHPHLQMETLVVLINVSAESGKACQQIYQNDCLSILVEFLHTKKSFILYYTISCLGNLASEGPKFRDYLIQANIINIMIKMIQKDENSIDRFTEDCCWVLCNLAKVQPIIKSQEIFKALKYICYLIAQQKTKTVQIVSYSLESISINMMNIVNIVVESGLIEFLVVKCVDFFIKQILIKKCSGMMKNYLKFAKDKVSLAQAKQFTGFITFCINSEYDQVIKNGCSCAHYLARISFQHSCLIWNHPGLFDRIVKIFYDATVPIKVQITYFLKEFSQQLVGLSFDEIILEKFLLDEMIYLIKTQEDQAIDAALQCLYTFFFVGQQNKRKIDKHSILAITFQQIPGAVDLLRLYEGDPVSAYAHPILDRFFKKQGSILDDINSDDLV